MNKKLLAGIIAGIALILVIVIAIVAVSGNFKTPNPNGGGSSSTDSSVSDNDNVASKNETPNGDVEFTVETQNAKENSTISVPVLIKNSPGFYAGTFVFEYDTNLLTYLNYEEGDILDEYAVENKNGKVSALINASKNADIKKDGTIITLTFKTKKKADQYKITVNDEGTMLGSYETGKEVEADILIGKATVK